jgi:hypothetical protein
MEISRRDTVEQGFIQGRSRAGDGTDIQTLTRVAPQSHARQRRLRRRHASLGGDAHLVGEVIGKTPAIQAFKDALEYHRRQGLEPRQFC